MARRGVGETKKHLARAERERRQRRWILTGAITVAVLLFVVLAYGIYDTTFVQPFKAVAVVNGETITSEEFEGRVRLIQRELLSQFNSYLQMEQFFGADPGVLQELRNLELQIQTQLANPASLGRDVLEAMIRQRILIEEAERQGTRVTQEEIQIEVQRNFNFFPEGTPTSAPTATLDPTEVAAYTATPTLTPGPSPTVGPTSTPRATETPYSEEAYQQDYKAFLDALSDFRIQEDAFLEFISVGLLESKMRENFVAEIDPNEEQVYLRVIVAENAEIAAQVKERLEAGESWDDLALELSQDVFSRENGGDIGWNTISDLINRFDEPGIAIFSGLVGEIGGPLSALEDDSSYVYLVEDRQERPVNAQALQLKEDQAFDAWLQGLRDEAEVTIADDWEDYLPPAIPLNIQ